MVINIENFLIVNPEFLYGILKNNLKQGIKSIVDFQTDENIPSLFWEETFGLIFKECKENNLDYSKHITFINIDVTTKENINLLFSSLSKDANSISTKLGNLNPFELEKELDKLFPQNNSK